MAAGRTSREMRKTVGEPTTALPTGEVEPTNGGCVHEGQNTLDEQLQATLAQPAAPARFLSSDIGTLKRVLVHSLAAGDINHDRESDTLLPYAEADMDAAVRQHAALMALLRAHG